MPIAPGDDLEAVRQAFDSPTSESAPMPEPKTQDDADLATVQEAFSGGAALKRSAFVAQDNQPDQYAKVIKLADQMGVAPRFIAGGDYDSLAKQAAQNNDQFDKVQQQAPGLAEFASNPDNLSVVKDDLDNAADISRLSSGLDQRKSFFDMGAIEFYSRLFGKASAKTPSPDYLVHAANSGFSQLDTTLAATAASEGLVSDKRQAAEMIIDARKRNRDIQATKPAYVKPFSEKFSDQSYDFNLMMHELTRDRVTEQDKAIDTVLQEGSFTVAQFLNSMLTPLLSTDPRGAAYYLAEQFPLSLPSMAGRAAGAAAGSWAGPVGGFIGGMLGGTGSQAVTEVGDKVMQSLERHGVNIDDVDELTKALSDSKLMAEVRKESRSGGLPVAVIENLWAMRAGSRMEALKKSPSLSRVGPITGKAMQLAPGLKEVLKAGGLDVAEQGLAGAVSAAAGEAGFAGGDVSKMNWSEIPGEFFGEILQAPVDIAINQAISKAGGDPSIEPGQPGPGSQEGLVVGGQLARGEPSALDNVLGQVGPTQSPRMQARDVALKTVDAMMAVSGASELQQIGNLAKESKLFARDLPDKVKELIALSGNPTIHFQVDDWDETWSKQGLSPLRAAEQITGSTDSYDEARATHGTIGIPLSDLAATTAATEHFDRLVDIARHSEDGSTPVEGMETLKAIPQEIARVAAAARQEKLKTEESLSVIKADVEQQMRQANVPESHISAVSEAISQGYRRLAQETGQDLIGLYSQAKSSGVKKEGVNLPFLHKERVLKQARRILQAKPGSDTDRVLLQAVTPELARPFYSQLQRTLDQKISGSSATVDQVRAVIRDLKPEEVKWSGIDEFLKGKSKVSKSEMMEYMRANEMRVEEVVKGQNINTSSKYALPEVLRVVRQNTGEAFLALSNDGDAYRALTAKFPDLSDNEDWASEVIKDLGLSFTGKGEPKFGQYQLPGGENYRELLLRMPEREAQDGGLEWKQNASGKWAWFSNGAQVSGAFQTDTHANRDAARRSLGSSANRDVANFRSSHFEESNILAHVRFNERHDTRGRRVLFIEEIQSDWHQKGRKVGYGDTKKETFFKPREEPDGTWVVVGNNGTIMWSGERETRAKDVAEEFNRKPPVTIGVPDAPFRKTWHEFALKRMIRWAAENGYDKIAWTTGEQQADRYDLSKQLKDVAYNPRNKELRATDKSGRTVINETVSESELPDYIGKDAADKLLNTPYDESNPYSVHTLIDEDLKVGGEGMKGFYDKILPDAAKKLARKFDKNAAVTTQDVSGAGKVHTLEITPAMSDAAMSQGFPLFQSDSEIPLGFYDPDSKEVGLLRGADIHTLIHELVGHHFMFTMQQIAEHPNASPQLKADMQTLRDFVGAEAGKELTRAQQEKLAKGMEAYWFEGKAPSNKLKKAFERVSRWMQKIYGHLSAIGVELTPEVRDVFNRLFASEQEIAEQALQTASPPIEGATVDEQAVLAKLDEEIAQEAFSKLGPSMLSGYQDEQRKIRKDEAARLRSEIEARFNDDPHYKAYAFLESGKKPNGEALPDGVQAFKVKPVEGLPESMTAKNGLEPAEAAAILGFKSVGDMVDTLKNMVPPAAAINASIEMAVKNIHGDPLLSGTLSEEAIKALHSDKSIEKILKESEILARKAGIKSPDRKIIMQQLRKRVDFIIGDQIVADTRPHKYYLDEKRALIEYGKALKSGDAKAAYEAKGRQLLAHELYRKAVEKVDWNERQAKWARQFENSPARSRLGLAGQDYLEQMDGLLARFEMADVPMRVLNARANTLPQWIAKKQASGESLGEDVYASPQTLDETYQKNFRQMRNSEFEDLISTMKQINQMAIHSNKMIAEGKRRTRSEAKAQLVGAIKENFKRRPPEPTSDEAKSFRQRLEKKGRQYDVALLKMEQLLDWMDGGNLEGPWHQLLWDGAVDAQAAEYDYTANVTAKINKAVMAMPKEMRKAMHDFIDVGQSRPLTRGDAYGMFLNAGTESNRSKMIRGEAGREDGLTQEQIESAIDLLEKPELDFLQSIFETLDSMKPDIGRLQKDLTGLEPEWLDPMPIKTRHRVYPGGYYPMMYDHVRSSQGQMQLGSRVGDLTEASYTKATTPRSHTKSRIEEFSAPLNYSIDNLPSHIAGVIKDLTHRKWLLDANWIVNDRSIRAAIADHMGDEYVTMLNDWVKRVANDRNANNMKSLSAYGQAIEKLRYNAAIATLGFKAATVTSQLVGAVNSIEVIGGDDGVANGTKWFNNGLQHVVKNPKAAYQQAIKESGELRHRFETRDRDLRDNMRLLRGKDDRVSQVKELSMLAIGWSEMMVSLPTYYAAKNKALSEGKSEKTAIKAGEKAVRLSQGASGAKDLSAIVASRNEFHRLITMFYTPYSAMYARYRDIGHKFGGIKDLPNAAMRTFLLWAVVGALSSLASGELPDEDDENGWMKWTMKAVGLGPLNTIPFYNNIGNAAYNKLIGLPYGYSISPLERIGVQTAKTVGTAYGVTTGEKEVSDLAKDMFNSAAYYYGVPGASQMNITGDYLYDLYTGGQDNPEDLGEFFHHLFYRRNTQ